ncbi:MAG: hypothetical protein J5971_00615 [Prevotella sp.]|nr:hypothetical protein [Prevotella sp.]
MKQYKKPTIEEMQLLAADSLLLVASNTTVNSFKGTKEAVTLGGDDPDEARATEGTGVWE